MKLLNTHLSKLSIFAGFLGILSQSLPVSAIPAQSTVEQRLCGYDGRYAVFALRPLGSSSSSSSGNNGRWRKPPNTNGIAARNNLLKAHEHIIFCSGHKIVRNVGFGGEAGGQRFSEDVTQADYVAFDGERYDSDIISDILGPDTCRTSEAGTYSVLTNNCQDFADRVRKEYWRKMFTGTWEGVFPCGPGQYILRYEVKKDYTLVQTVVQHGGNNCLPNGHVSTIGQIPKGVSKGKAFTVIVYLGTGSQTVPASIRITDANTFEYQSTGYQGTVLRRIKD